MEEKTSKQPEVFETKTAKIWEWDKGILICEVKQDANIVLEDAIEQIAIATELTALMEWAMLVDVRLVNSVTKEARVYYSDESVVKGRCAIAMLVDSYFSKMISNFFITYSKPAYPIKLFTSKTKAIEWLKKHIR